MSADAATLAEQEIEGVPTRASSARSAPRRLKPTRGSGARRPNTQSLALSVGHDAVWTPRIRERTNWRGTRRATTSAETLETCWKAAFDAASAAIHHADRYLPPEEVHRRATLLGAELDLTTKLLQALARDQHAHGCRAPSPE
jgi:hypothetical protein